MAQRLRGRSGRHTLARAGERGAGPPLPLRDRDAAERLLRDGAADPARLAALRRWAVEADLLGPRPQAVAPGLADALVRERIALRRLPVRSPGSVADEPETPGAEPPPPAPPPPGPTKTAELVVTVKDCDGEPVEEAEVTAGALGRMQTDANGIADYGRVRPGTYTITAEKVGHSTERSGPIEADRKADVSVPDGSRTRADLIQHPQCAHVCTWEGPTARWDHFGFDHKTDMVPRGSPTDAYWEPVPDHGTLSVPGDRMTRDGARWVSVAVGEEVALEITFDFKDTECLPCIPNTEFEVSPGSVAEVVTKKIGRRTAAFVIKGKAPGEATLRAHCDGHDIGWFHIWCENEAVIRIDVANLVTARAPASGYDLSALHYHFADIYRQAAMRIDMVDLGQIEVGTHPTVAAVEANGYPPTGTAGRFLDKSGSPRPYDSKVQVITALHAAANSRLAARTTGPLPRAGAYRLYWYVPTAGCSILGTVINIGSNVGFVFRADDGISRNSAAHEFGHCLGLRHPSDSSAGPQYPGHCIGSLGGTVPSWPATNTENAVAGRAPPRPGAHGNVMQNDPANLMGYWHDRPNRKPLRYLQWKAASRS